MTDSMESQKIILRSGDITASFSDFGARLLSLFIPVNGESRSVVLGFETIDEYRKDTSYHGCIAGRFANRIKEGKFSIEGKEYSLSLNDNGNTLHGGVNGFDKKSWKIENQSEDTVEFSYLSEDGEEGFPGNLNISVTYILKEEGKEVSLFINYKASTDKTTPVSLTNHAYFNLNGAGSGSIENHELKLNSDFYTPVDEKLIPTGEVKSVRGTPFDLRERRKLKEVIKESGGLDHNFVLRERGLREAAILYSEESQITLKVETDMPGIQVYSGNFLDGTHEGIGGVYGKHGGICLETQQFPDSPNITHFPTPFLKPGDLMTSTTVYRFILP